MLFEPILGRLDPLNVISRKSRGGLFSQPDSIPKVGD